MNAIPQRGARSLVASLVAMLVLAPALVAQERGGPETAAPVELGAAPRGPVGFQDWQLTFPRVRLAHEARADVVRDLFLERGVEHPAEVFLRVFKREQILEVWARDEAATTFVLLDSYPMCGSSGHLGPKREQGDEQIPEGFYSIHVFNPESQFHLSLGVDYPNAVDRARSAPRVPGGDIYVHGGCSTVGCVPVTDGGIEEIYLIAMTARDAGQQRIPIHMFPTRLDDDGFDWLVEAHGLDHPDVDFWRDLRTGYEAFERSRIVPRVGQHNGRYTFPLGVPHEQ